MNNFTAGVKSFADAIRPGLGFFFFFGLLLQLLLLTLGASYVAQVVILSILFIIITLWLLCWLIDRFNTRHDRKARRSEGYVTI